MAERSRADANGCEMRSVFEAGRAFKLTFSCQRSKLQGREFRDICELCSRTAHPGSSTILVKGAFVSPWKTKLSKSQPGKPNASSSPMRKRMRTVLFA